MVEKEVVVAGVQVDRNARLQDRRDHRVGRRCDLFHGEGGEDCTVAGGERLIGRVDGFTHAGEAEIVGESGNVRDVFAVG